MSETKEKSVNNLLSAPSTGQLRARFAVRGFSVFQLKQKIHENPTIKFQPKGVSKRCGSGPKLAIFGIYSGHPFFGFLGLLINLTNTQTQTQINIITMF
jgi:hypothetical protein